ncbi:DUF551 domain-containing protein [Yersinia enterocolitica]|uniref:DUF551 domain-containing protein n=1 Tax=Yersinia enterocolitica TaxID=630 RepID=UPI00065A8C0A|nr:DUF551 domain-containing protein [Yersinia enterocolitica]CRY10809.1 Protein of uncharacterised function (DUF551) [Yersinia enterocolitica]
MKELDSFTVERLEELSTKENIPEVAALARIALAAKRAEPWGYEVSGRLFNSLFAAGNYASEMRCDTLALYTTPQFNSPEIPEGWIKCSDRMPEDDTLCLGVDEIGVIWTMHFDDGEWRADTGHVDDLKISHWMPLPDSPEKENG